ncbi:Dabb family protein [Rhodococcus triatomae]
MIHHIIPFNIKPNVTDDQVGELLEILRRQATDVPAVLSAHVGRVHGESRSWGAVFVLADLDAYWDFITHPAHLEVDNLGWPVLDDFSMFDIADNLDPSFGDAISALHARRIAEYPELAGVVELTNDPAAGERKTSE